MNLKLKNEPALLEQANRYVYYAYDSGMYADKNVTEKEALAKRLNEITATWFILP